jgi:hypothetical protein
LVNKFPVAQAFQPVQAQAKARGYILPEAQKFLPLFPSPPAGGEGQGEGDKEKLLAIAIVKENYLNI